MIKISLNEMVIKIKNIFLYFTLTSIIVRTTFDGLNLDMIGVNA